MYTLNYTIFEELTNAGIVISPPLDIFIRRMEALKADANSGDKEDSDSRQAAS